jgi:GTP pyrophosphokinase
MAPVLVIALGLRGVSSMPAAYVSLKRACTLSKKEAADRRRLPWEAVAAPKSGTKKKRAKGARRGIRGHVVPEAAPDAIRGAVASARRKLEAIAEERSFSAPEKTEEDQGLSPAQSAESQAWQEYYKSYRRQLSYKSIDDSPAISKGLAEIAENHYCDVAAGEQEPAPPTAPSDSSHQALLISQCFSIWPTLSRKLSYMKSEDRTLVWRALCVACASSSTARKGRCRSLDQFTTVALILADLELDVATVAAGLLHNVLEETELSADDLTTLFSEEVSTIVIGCTKVSKLRGMPPHALTDAEQAENLREMLLAMADDSRVILLKCAVRLYEMRTLSSYSSFWRERTAIAQETLDIFVPLAGKSGIYAIKAELADLAFKHLQPVEYRTLSERVDNHTRESDAELERALTWLNERIHADKLLDAHCATVSISGRVKNLHSIWQKSQVLGTPASDPGANIEDITDIYAARMILDYPQQPWETDEEYRDRGIALCYHVFGLLESKLWTECLSKEHIFEPTWTADGAFKDYIAVPKPNGYQSLHTVVTRKLPVEVQVRTRWMHLSAEYGIASHWLYKDHQAGLTKLRSYKSAFLEPLNRLDAEIVDSKTFLDSVRKELLGKRTFVYLPDNRILNLPRGATALDAAFKIHTDIGICMNRAFVNGDTVHASTTLQNGDRIFIEIAETPQVTEAWVENAWTRSSRAKVRQYLRMQDQTNELQAHLMQKELSAGETSRTTATVGDGNHGFVHESTGEQTSRVKIAHEPARHQTSRVKYEWLSKDAEGKVRRAQVGDSAKQRAEDPLYALL